MAGTMTAPDPTRTPGQADSSKDGGDPAAPEVEGAGGVVFDPRGRVLLIRHRSGRWVFPKGHIDPGESHLQAAVREVEEEAGIAARCLEPTSTWTTRYVNDRGQPRRITWYRLSSEEARPVMREDLFPEGAFLPPEEALARLSHDEDRQLLRRILES